MTTEHLSIPVAEDEGDNGSLEGVEEDVCVLVNCKEIAAAWVQPEQGKLKKFT